ncbi:MAG: ABC transporter substrate-binding protein [Anaerolineae bacterium]|jgi:peptide/nickel transport system substrate-binding protein
MRKLASQLLVIVMLTGLVAACAPAPTPEVVEKEVIVEKEVPITVEVEKEKVVQKEVPVTVEIEKEVVVEKKVEVTKEVEKEVVVTATPAPGKVRYGGTAVVASATKALVLDPGYAESGDDIRIAYHIYDTLVQYKRGTTEIVPGLAESWDVSEDGTVWTFHLRESVKFHDGTDFSADAVVFNYMRFLDEEHPFYQVGGTWSYFDYLLGAQIEEIVAVDDHTVKFVLRDKFAPFLVSLAYYPSGIVSPSALEKWGEDFIKHPVGTGPFKLEEWVTDQYVSVVANDGYWGGRPYLDKIVFETIPEPSAGLLALRGGDAHVLAALSPEQMEVVKNDPHLDMEQVPGANLSWVLLNQEFEPLKDVRVRQALNHAVNVEKIVEALWGGTAIRAINPYPPTMPCWNDEVEAYEYDPEKAKELLAEAGYADGFDMQISFSLPRPYLPYPEAVAQAVAADLQNVGINAVAREVEWGEFSDKSNARELMAPQSGWYDVPAINNFMNAMILQGGYSKGDNYPDEAFDLAEKAVRTYDMDERCEYYKQLQQIFHDHADRIPLAHSAYQTGVSKDLHGYVLGADGQDRLIWAWLEE